MTPEALARVHAAAMADRPWSAAEFRGLLTSPSVFLVAGGGAFALGRAVADEAELLTLATPPDLRRRGLGRARLADFERQSAWRGARQAWLEVAEDNAAALALYRASGWTVAGRRHGYYPRAGAEAVDALLMQKRLDADALVG